MDKSKDTVTPPPPHWVTSTPPTSSTTSSSTPVVAKSTTDDDSSESEPSFLMRRVSMGSQDIDSSESEASDSGVVEHTVISLQEGVDNEDTLLNDKGGSLPRVELEEKILFFHGPMTRHQAESLLHHGGRVGMYLLRELVSTESGLNGNLCLSVRGHKAVSHFKIVWDGNKFVFGAKVLKSVDRLLDYFNKFGAVEDTTGHRLTLSKPYPRDITTNSIYEQTMLHVAWQPIYEEQKLQGLNKKGRLKKIRADKVALQASTESKEGYLSKLGYYRKNWKTRWFVLHRNKLKYYKAIEVWFARGNSKKDRSCQQFGFFFLNFTFTLYCGLKHTLCFLISCSIRPKLEN
eukprot:m.20380 g.20380  ORF g.20380 m.20380 type:complete len:346 (+) comp5246_c0_seq1:37-1074(+)